MQREKGRKRSKNTTGARKTERRIRNSEGENQQDKSKEITPNMTHLKDYTPEIPSLQ